MHSDLNEHFCRSMCCANLPVTFRPIQKGVFTDVLVVRTEGSPDIHVTLKAKAETL